MCYIRTQNLKTREKVSCVFFEIVFSFFCRKNLIPPEQSRCLSLYRTFCLRVQNFPPSLISYFESISFGCDELFRFIICLNTWQLTFSEMLFSSHTCFYLKGKNNFSEKVNCQVFKPIIKRNNLSQRKLLLSK